MYPILGIDYGKVRIGLAIAAGPLAEPLSTIASARFFSVLPQIVSQQSIKNIVVGFSDEKLSDDILEFLTQIENCLPKPAPDIFTQDETLSTYDAKRALQHTTPRRRRSHEHAVAAAIILQSWLDSRPSTSVKYG